MIQAASHCPYCALQCPMTLTAPDSALPVTISSDAGLCKKGWSAAELLSTRERLRSPLLKRDGVFTELEWEEALDLAAAKIKATVAQHGNDGVGVFGSGSLTNEKAYQLGKFARLAIGTSRIDYNGRFCMSSAAAAGNRAFGVDRGLPFPLADLDHASVILLLGSNVADTMPPFVRHLSGARNAGGLIVVDPRRSATADLCSTQQGIHVQPVPGTDLELLLGLTHVVIREGWQDADYVRRRTTGFEEIKRSVAPWWPERTSSITGVPVTILESVAKHLAQAKNCFILTGRGIEQHVNGTATATAAINLGLLLGLPGRAGSGYGTLTGQGNGQGGREHGQKSDQLPGYRKISDPAARKHLAKVWQVPESTIPGPGLPAIQLLQSLGRPGGVRALLVHGSNIAVSAPDRNVMVERLRSLDFLMVTDYFFSETAAEADLVLPVAQWAEEEGTMTNLEGRVIRRRRVLTPPEGVRDELWVLRQLALRLAPYPLAADRLFSDVPSEIFSELGRASQGGIADYSGITYEDLDRGEDRYWPCPVQRHDPTGMPRLFTKRFAHPDGRARMVPVSTVSSPSLGERSGKSSLHLITGRLLDHYQSGSQTRRVQELSAAAPDCTVQLHPVTANQHGIIHGDWVTLFNERGSIRARAELGVGNRMDTVFVPFHFAHESAVNQLTSTNTDPISGMPEFKNALVWIRVDRMEGRSA